jgi:hypothetical protein
MITAMNTSNLKPHTLHNMNLLVGSLVVKSLRFKLEGRGFETG